MRILIDMDGVIANHEKGFLDAWRKTHPEKPYIPLEKRTTFYQTDQYPPQYKKEAHQITINKYFFSNLEVIPGARNALEEMIQMGIETFICTSPNSYNPYCASEKLEWMEKHFGFEWKNRTIITKDKTLVKGDILIDDRPIISGADIPTWEHVHYEQPFNKGYSNKRINWTNWKEILKI